VNLHTNYTHSMAISQRKFYAMSPRRRKKAREFINANALQSSEFESVWLATWLE
jgi:hypothetical protein